MRHSSRCILGTAVAVALFAFPALADDPNAWVPDFDIVQVVDAAALTVPAANAPGPLTGYARYYWGSFNGDRPIIQGIMVSTSIQVPPPPMPNPKGMLAGKFPDFVFIVSKSDAPSPDGGGCGVIRISYDVQFHKLTKSACNPPTPSPQPPKN